MVKILAPGFYARQNIKTPVKIALITLVATQIMNLLFVWKLQHAGLALAIGLGACLNAGLLLWKLRTQGIFQPQNGWYLFILKIALATTMMAIALWLGMGDQETWLHTRFHERILHLAGLVVLGAGVYFISLRLLGIHAKQFIRRAA
jgi:putative peptidoglycan lipid II flippase